MFGDLLKSVASVADSVVTVVVAPVAIAASVADAAAKPIADGVQAVVDEVKDLTGN